MKTTKVAVIGMGYVGIPAAVLFADIEGLEVVGVQRRSQRSGWKIDFLNQGRSPFPDNEPEIADLIRRVALEKKSFRVTHDLGAVAEADAVLIDVQTPVEEDHKPRYESLIEVSGQIGKLLRRGTLVCVESTVAPGTTVNLVKPILEEQSGMKAGSDFNLAFSYERVMVGRLLHNIRNYPRIVGGITPACGERAAELYRNIVRAPVVVTDALTAEVAKTVENAYRDVNIAFANEVALMCESLGVDVFEVRELVNNLPNDPSNPGANPVRNMHVPGAGVGGHCLPKDSWLLKYGVDTYGKTPVESKVIIGSREVNDSMPVHMADLAEKALEEAGIPLAKARIAILGYAFLEESDDTRNTPAEPLIRILTERGVGEIVIHDPYVREEELPGVKRDLIEALRGCHCACLVTAHSVYRTADLRSIGAVMAKPVFVDGRNALPEPPEGTAVITLGKQGLEP
ncbi:MAG: nucleotide sugar dehydrogenase [Spirochaetales bacterium]|nr:nucleotide sugar dehydrogenase [Spirochaetales bacterium]